jgi:hypothetical protein
MSPQFTGYINILSDFHPLHQLRLLTPLSLLLTVTRTIKVMQNTFSFVVSPRTAALSHRKLVFTGKSRDNCRA